MPKFKEGELVKFIDIIYAKQEGMKQYYNKECIVLPYPYQYSSGEILVAVKFWDGFIFCAFEKRFLLVENKTSLELKINQMYKRQPYYKTLKVVDQSKQEQASPK